MSEEIKHEGIITGIDKTTVQVRIEQLSACAGCHAKGACSAADKAEKVIDAEIRDGNGYQLGERVLVVGRSGLGLKAVLIAFVVPFLIIIAAVAIASLFTDSEFLSGVIGICSWVPYAAVLVFFRKRLQLTFRFIVAKL